MKTQLLNQKSNIITIISKSIISLLFMVVVLSHGCSKDEPVVATDLISQINALPAEALNADESNFLLLMREEEKLAKDVYVTLYAKWNVNVFLNISSSEQDHTDAVLVLINKYSLVDPVTTTEVGVFTDDHLQELYDQLVATGSTSVLDAYKVGATIEDLDIFDLKEAISKTDNQDLNLVWENLSMGSRNHMRSFYGQIVGLGSTYSAQFISQEELTAIISTPRENNNQ